MHPCVIQGLLRTHASGVLWERSTPEACVPCTDEITSLLLLTSPNQLTSRACQHFPSGVQPAQSPDRSI